MIKSPDDAHAKLFGSDLSSNFGSFLFATYGGFGFQYLIDRPYKLRGTRPTQVLNQHLQLQKR